MWIVAFTRPDSLGATKVTGTMCSDFSAVPSGAVTLKPFPSQVTSVTRNGSLPLTTICLVVFWPGSTTPREQRSGACGDSVSNCPNDRHVDFQQLRIVGHDGEVFG